MMLCVLCVLCAFCAHAENAYTNHAGHVVSGWPVKLTQREVTLAECIPDSRLSPTNIEHQTSNIELQTSNIKHQTSNSQLSTPNSKLTTTYPLSIFPTNEQRRIAADFLLRQGSEGQVGLLRIPDAVKRAVSGAEKAMARSRKRAEKGLCTKEESDDFCAKSAAALKSYLDKQVRDGVITQAERAAIGR